MLTMLKEVNNWLEQAQSDLAAAQSSVKERKYDWASFQAQQAAEKTLKALLIQKNQIIPKVHDLVFLAKKAALPQELVAKCDQLSKVYIDTRYPDMEEDIPSKRYTKEMAQNHITIADEVLQWAKKNI